MNIWPLRKLWMDCTYKWANDNLVTFVCEAMFALVYYVASWLVCYSITQCCINSFGCKLIAVLALAICFNKFIIMFNILIYLVLVLTSFTKLNDSTLLGNIFLYNPKLFIFGIILYRTNFVTFEDTV